MGRSLKEQLLALGLVKEQPRKRRPTPPVPSEEQLREAQAARDALRSSLPRAEDMPSSASAEGRVARREVEDGDVPRVTGTMHWMHKSVPVLEIHGRSNSLLTPEEIEKMRRR